MASAPAATSAHSPAVPTWGFQNNAVAYQLPSAVVGGDEDAATADLERSSSFLVQCRVYTGSVEVGRSDGRSLPQRPTICSSDEPTLLHVLVRKAESTDLDQIAVRGQVSERINEVGRKRIEDEINAVDCALIVGRSARTFMDAAKTLVALSASPNLKCRDRVTAVYVCTTQDDIDHEPFHRALPMGGLRRTRSSSSFCCVVRTGALLRSCEGCTRHAPCADELRDDPGGHRWRGSGRHRPGARRHLHRAVAHTGDPGNRRCGSGCDRRRRPVGGG